MPILAIALLFQTLAAQPAPQGDGTDRAPAYAPLPFTAASIRDAMPTGTRMRFSFEADGGPPQYQIWTVTDHTEYDMELEVVLQGPKGAPTGVARRSRDTWETLVAHAALPSANTLRMEASLDTAMGPKDCWLYQVDGAGPDGTPQTDRFWFARDLPGPPVRWESSSAGRVTGRFILLERLPGPLLAPVPDPD